MFLPAIGNIFLMIIIVLPHAPQLLLFAAITSKVQLLLSIRFF